MCWCHSKSALAGYETEQKIYGHLFSPSERCKIRYFAGHDKMFPGAHVVRPHQANVYYRVLSSTALEKSAYCRAEIVFLVEKPVKNFE
jgi:hypothetical protein